MYIVLLLEMKRKNVTMKDIADTLNWNYETVRNKFNGISDWKREEMYLLRDTFFKEFLIDNLFKKTKFAD